MTLLKSIKKTVAACLLLAAQQVFSQTPQWIFANNGGSYSDAYRMGQTPPMQVTGFTTAPWGITSNMITDAAGNRLFAVIDNEGYDDLSSASFGQMIYYETKNSAPYVASVSPMGYTEKIIFPAPKAGGGVDCNRYYVINTGAFYERDWEYKYDPFQDEMCTRGTYEPYYSVVNMNTNNHDQYFDTLMTKTQGANTYICTAMPLLDMVPGMFHGGTGNPNISNTCNFIAVSKLRSDNTYFLFFSFKEQIYRYVVSSTGVTYGGVVVTLPTAAGYTAEPGEMEVYNKANGEYRLALTHYSSGFYQIYCCELDASGVIKSSPAPTTINLSPVSANYPYIHGLEFSPDGNYLYVSHETNTSHPNPLEYCAFGATSLTPLPSAPANKANFAKGHIEWNKESGTDYLYFASATELGKLAAPNTPTLTTSWSVAANTASGYQNELSYLWDELDDSWFDASPSPPYQISYLLPDYIDREDYLSGYQADECCEEYKANFTIKESITMPATVGGSSTYTVTNGSNITATGIGGPVPVAFTSTTTTNGNITIPNGTKVTFQNLRIEFSPNAALIVNAHATPGQQGGKVVLNATTLSVFDDCNANAMWQGVLLNGYDNQNQGTTSNSQHGVLTTVGGASQIDHALTAIKLDHGAIVQFTGTSKLLDNKVALEATPYTSPSNPLNDVSLFSNCIIKTQSTSNSYPDLSSGEYLIRLTGRNPTMRFTTCTIKNEKTSQNNLYDGIISNDSRVNLSVSCAVSNLRYGVKHTNIAAQCKLTSYGNTYSNNQCAILVSNSNYASVTYGTFQLLSAPVSAMYGVGLYLDQSSKFTVSTNVFYNLSYPAGAYSLGTIGIVANNTNKKDSTINIIRENTFYNLSEGAQNFNKNFLYGGTPINDQGLRYYCNKFVAPIDWCDIGVHSGAIDYHQGRSYVPNDSAASNEFSHTTSIDFYYNAWGTPTTVYTVPNSTIDYYYHTGTTNGQPNVPGSYYVSAIPASGNANNCSGSGPGAKLIQGSTDPASLVHRIKELDESIAQVKSQNSGVSVSAQISSLKAEMNQLQIALVNYYLEDTTVVSGSDSALKYMIQFEANTPYKGNLVSLYLQQGKVNKAQKVYNQIVADQAGSNYQKIYGVVMELYGKNIQRELVTNTQLFETVTLIANDESDMAAYLMAQSLLNMIGLKTYQEPIMSMQSTSSERKNQEVADQIKTVYNLSNFPNPFNGSTTLTAFVPKGTASASIVVVDVLGREVAKFNLTEGNNSFEFDKQDVEGILYFSLFIDGIRKETKMMMKN